MKRVYYTEQFDGYSVLYINGCKIYKTNKGYSFSLSSIIHFQTPESVLKFLTT